MPSLIAVLGFDTGPFNKGMDSAQAKARSGGKGIESSFGGLGKSLAGFASAGAIGAAIHSTVEYAGKVNDLSLRLGISTDAVQEWDYALKQNGSSIDAAVGFFEKLGVNRQKALAGNDEAIASFGKLGVSMENLRTGRVEDIATTIAQAFQTGDPQELIASLREVGGKGAGDMVAAFRDGLGSALKDAPLISQEDIERLDEFGDKLAALKAENQAGVAQVLTGLLGYLSDSIDGIKIAMNMVIGAFLGVKETLSQMSLFDLLNPLKTITNAARISGAAITGAKEFGSETDREQDERDDELKRAQLRKRERLTQGLAAVEDEVEDKKAEKEAAREEAKAARESERLAAKEQAAEAKAQADAIKEAEKNKKEGGKMGANSVNSLQQSGAFFGNYASAGTTLAPEMAALNVQTKSEQHLAKIVLLLSQQSDESTGQGTSF